VKLSPLFFLAPTQCAAWLPGLSIVAVCLLAAGGLFLFGAEFMAREYFNYSPFSDRDLFRAADMFNHFPVSAAETSGGNGFRVPGGGMYYILKVILSIDPSPQFVWNFYFFLTIGSLGFLFWSILAHASILSATIAVAGIISSNELIIQQFIIYNPTFGLPFFIISIGFLLLYLKNSRRLNLILFFTFCFISTQAHLNYLLVPIAVLISNITARTDSLRHILLLFAVVISVVYAPFLIDAVYPLATDYKSLAVSANISIGTASPLAADNNATAFSGGKQYGLISRSLPELFSFGLKRLYVLGIAETSEFLLVLPLFTLGIAAFSLYHGALTGQHHEIPQYAILQTVFRLLVVSLVVVALYTLWRSHGRIIGVTNRYSIFYIILGGITFALSVEVMLRLNVVRQKHWWNVLIIFCVTGVLLARVLGVGERIYKVADTEGKYTIPIKYQPGSMYEQFVQYAITKKILSDLSKTYGISGAEMLDKVGIAIRRTGSNWFMRQFEREFILRSPAYSTNGSSFNKCILILYWGAGRGPQATAPDLLNRIGADLFMGDFANLGAQFDSTPMVRDRYAMIPYKSRNGWCIRSFPNRFIWTPQDWEIEKTFKGNDSPIPQVARDENDQGRIFVDIPFIFKASKETLKVRLKLLLEIVYENKLLKTMLHSNQLRGGRETASGELTGFWEPLTIHDAKLIFENTGNGKIFKQEIYTGYVGLEPLVTPWDAIPIKIDPGIYRVTLMAEGVRPSWYPEVGRRDFSSIPVDLLIHETLEIK
jgi:hypothetical protein